MYTGTDVVAVFLTADATATLKKFECVWKIV